MNHIVLEDDGIPNLIGKIKQISANLEELLNKDYMAPIESRKKKWGNLIDRITENKEKKQVQETKNLNISQEIEQQTENKGFVERKRDQI